MKVCPKCNQKYTDENLNFCLNDGEYLSNDVDDAPPTMVMDAPRITNQTNWNQYQPPRSEPLSPRQNQPNIQNQPFGVPAFNQSLDQTLPTVSLVLGILGFLLICCYGGFPLGLAAIITGYLGMKNAHNSPMQYGGRGLAIGGLVLGIVSLLSSFVFIIIAILAN
ncbi:MAG: DUF4190 domain-containing protein [Pyrinomonadaceae bacterium]|nr:DUF4190 domain-containing protein [Pyrinomonadaceae bacterium]